MSKPAPELKIAIVLDAEYEPFGEDVAEETARIGDGTWAAYGVIAYIPCDHENHEWTCPLAEHASVWGCVTDPGHDNVYSGLKWIKDEFLREIAEQQIVELSMTDDLTLAERIMLTGITLESRQLEYGDTFPEWADQGDPVWETTLVCGDERLFQHFVPSAPGYGLPRGEPTVEMVLDYALSVVSHWDNADDIGEFIGTYFDLDYTDEAELEAGMEKIRRIEDLAEQLKALLGDTYELFLWKTSRD